MLATNPVGDLNGDLVCSIVKRRAGGSGVDGGDGYAGLEPPFLDRTIDAARKSTETLNSAIGDARPGLQTFSRTTVPEANRLVHDLRVSAAALSSIAERVDQQGVSSLVGQQKLSDYKGK